MIRLSNLLWSALIVGAGIFLFHIKYEVIQQEAYLEQTKRQIIQDRQNIHLLKAEWVHLTEPTRLSRLSEQYLKLSPIVPTQLGSIRNLDTILISHTLASLNSAPLSSSLGNNRNNLSNGGHFSNLVTVATQNPYMQPISLQQSPPRIR
ncbi:MAG TPA: hypothetical protein PK803_05610 [Alphaproteobacteria bacterium]|nr:hypothetical protein [Alphaproteobacteria bacterium]